MATTHSVTVGDGTSDLTLTWSMDGSRAVAQDDGKPIEIVLTRESVFAIWQFCGTVLNCIADADGDEE